VTTQLKLKRADNHEIDTRDGSDFEDSRLARYTMAYSYPGDPSQQFLSRASHQPTSVRVQHSKYHFNSDRAAANLAEWSTYLPADCVAAMMRDGWQLTT
jgi:hypothetical protein